MKNQNNKYPASSPDKSGVNVNELKNAVKNGSTGSYLEKNLSPDAAEKIKRVLSDKNAVQRLMSTPQAKELMKKFSSRENLGKK